MRMEQGVQTLLDFSLIRSAEEISLAADGFLDTVGNGGLLQRDVIPRLLFGFYYLLSYNLLVYGNYEGCK